MFSQNLIVKSWSFNFLKVGARINKLNRLRFMIPIIPLISLIPLYTATDFVIDEKKEIERLGKLYKKASSPEEQAEINEQIAYVYSQGLSACYRFKREVPECVRAYYLGSREKPSVDEITSELQKINYYSGYKFNKRVIKGVIIATIIILTVIALCF